MEVSQATEGLPFEAAMHPATAPPIHRSGRWSYCRSSVIRQEYAFDQTGRGRGDQNSKGTGKGQSSLGLLEPQSPPSFFLIKKGEGLQMCDKLGTQVGK